MLRRLILAVLAAIAITCPAQATEPAKTWIPTWYASPEPTDKTAVVHDLTLRQTVRVSAGGNSVRLRLSNAYGKAPLRIDAVTIARRTTGSAIDPAAMASILFNGQPGATIAPGAWVLSDPVSLTVPANSDLAVSLYAAAPTPVTTLHDMQRGALYAAPGDLTHASALPETPIDLGIGDAMPWLAEVEVADSAATGAVIAFGDSITDGYGIDPDSGGTWPQVLSARFAAAGIPLSVVNAGISGNRLLHHGQWITFGEDGLARFDRDVIAQPNARAVIVLLGINDLGHDRGPGSPEFVTAAGVIDGLDQLAERAHERGLKIYAVTLLPFIGTVFDGFYSEEKEQRRQAINAWMRGTQTFDGVFDLDKVMEDPAAPGHLRPEFDVGDHLHPNLAGARMIADSIPLDAFAWAKPVKAIKRRH